MPEEEKPEEMYDIAIIGSGVSGLAASIYAGRFDLKTIVIGDNPGGTIVLTNDIANYPGFKQITGIELAEKIRDHAKEYNVEMVTGKVSKVERDPGGCFRLSKEDGKVYHAKTVIFATGTEIRKLGVKGEQEFTGKGVHYCALCDGAFYRDKIVGVIGGSDSAAKESLLLSEYANKVYIICRGDNIRPEPITYKRVMANKKIEIICNTSVEEIKGEKFVTSITLDKPYKNSTDFKLDAVFVEIGHIPLTGRAKDIGVKLNRKGEIIIDRDSKTNIPGIFAAGDVVNTSFKQAITGVGEGVAAAYQAYHYLEGKEFICLRNDEDMP